MGIGPKYLLGYHVPYASTHERPESHRDADFRMPVEAGVRAETRLRLFDSFVSSFSLEGRFEEVGQRITTVRSTFGHRIALPPPQLVSFDG